MTTTYRVQLSDGPGRPLVLSHALGLDHSMWSAWADRHAGLRPILAYDHRGQGRSPMTATSISLQALVDDAATLIEQWRRGPVVWIGLSQGGMVGQGLAIQRPDLVSGLVLAHTTAIYPDAGKSAWVTRIAAVREGGMAAVADLVTQRYLSEAFRAEYPQATANLRTQILENDAAGYCANCQAVADVDWIDQLHRIKCPTLILAGALDAGATPAMAQAMHERIAGSTMDVFEKASHLSPLERPEDFDRAVQSFLNELEKA